MKKEFECFKSKTVTENVEYLIFYVKSKTETKNVVL
jgi:hypothetical protein